ncbi:MAG: serine hydrolase domain-containing protein [Pseudomonadota bacterium]
MVIVKKYVGHVVYNVSACKHMFVALLLCVTFCQSVVAGQEIDFETLDPYFEKTLEKWQTPGMTLAIVQGKKTLATKGYGVRKLGTEDPVDGQTMFALGSTSKAFAAATVAALVDRGDISFDDHVRQYLPWFEIYDPALSDRVNIRDLLTHRIGTSVKNENPLRPISKNARDHLMRSSKLVKPVAAFRDRYVYSNNMFIASGLLVAAVSGETWPDFAKETLWTPLKMVSTNANVVAARSRSNAASPHAIDDDGALKSFQWNYPDAVAVPSGGVNSNAVDMANWLKFQLAEGSAEGKQLISEAVFNQMHAQQTAVADPSAASDIDSQFPGPIRDRGNMRFWSYGMGWYVTEYRGRKLIYHSGSIDGFRAGVALLPEENLGIYVGVNRRSRLPFPIILSVFDSMLEISPKTDWSKEYLSLK